MNGAELLTQTISVDWAFSSGSSANGTMKRKNTRFAYILFFFFFFLSNYWEMTYIVYREKKRLAKNFIWRREFPLAMVKMHLGDFKKRREKKWRNLFHIPLVMSSYWRMEILNGERKCCVFSSWFPNFFLNLTYF